jgi:hypothetical protein
LVRVSSDFSLPSMFAVFFFFGGGEGRVFGLRIDGALCWHAGPFCSTAFFLYSAAFFYTAPSSLFLCARASVRRLGAG